VRDLWGEEDSPGIDGDPRLHILFVRGLGGGTGAYFARRHTFPDEVIPGSNEREMFFVNLDAYGLNIDSPVMEATLAHEFQHMIRENLDGNPDTWLNEAMSTFTERYLGYDTNAGIFDAFLSQPDTQLNTFGETDTPRSVNYGAGFAFVTYFYERYGEEGIRRIGDTTDGERAIDRALQSMEAPGFDDLFADWVIANAIQDVSFSDGRYGYQTVAPPTYPAVRGVYDDYPAVIDHTLNQYATDYIIYDGLGNSTTLDVAIDMPQSVGLIPTTAPSGIRLWYANRADASETTLTRAFDLTALNTATLDYKLWYEIEEEWDYAYIMVSVDDGATWEILPAPHTVTADSFGNSYGPGYTGDSDGWIAETVSLDAYTGNQILVRFEMITDDAVTLPGFAIDDVKLSQLDYYSDFETDDGGWESRGWLLMDNRLPQSAWVQAIQFDGGDPISVTTWRAPNADGWTLDLEDGVDRVALAISPFAHTTTVPLPYTLTVTPR
jgi:hypothetical protein